MKAAGLQARAPLRLSLLSETLFLLVWRLPPPSLLPDRLLRLSLRRPLLLSSFWGVVSSIMIPMQGAIAWRRSSSSLSFWLEQRYSFSFEWKPSGLGLPPLLLTLLLRLCCFLPLLLTLLLRLSCFLMLLGLQLKFLAPEQDDPRLDLLRFF